MPLPFAQGQSRRPAGGAKEKGRSAAKALTGRGKGGGGSSGQPNIKKAAFESTKKKEIGVSDLTLLSKVSNEGINENLKLRFKGGEIYVGWICVGQGLVLGNCADNEGGTDLYWPCAGFGEPVSRS